MYPAAYAESWLSDCNHKSWRESWLHNTWPLFHNEPCFIMNRGIEEHESCVDTSHLRPLVHIPGPRKSFPLNICISPVVIVDVSDSSCYVLGSFQLRRYRGFPVNKQRKRRTWGWHMKMKNVARFVVKEHEAAIWKMKIIFRFFWKTFSPMRDP